MNRAQDYKELLENILKTSLELYNMQNSPNFQRKKLFIEAIENIMLLNHKSEELYQNTGINLLEWENNYFKIIEQLLELCFGPEIAEIINVYIYAEPETDEYQVEYIMEDKSTVIIKTTEELYNLVMNLISSEIENESNNFLDIE
jgi:hypothetical protein